MSASKRPRLSDLQSDQKETVPHPVNYDLCVLCQDNSEGSMTNPALSKRVDIGIGHGYNVMAENILAFKNINCMPMDINIEALEAGEGIAVNLAANKAKWHVLCGDKFSKTKFKRAQERTEKSETVNNSEPRMTRSQLNDPGKVESKCFFCNKPGTEKLWEARSFQIDKNVH